MKMKFQECGYIICMYMYIHTVYGTKQYNCDGQLESELQLDCTPSKVHPAGNFPRAHRSISTLQPILHPIKHRMQYNYHTDVE